MENASKALIYAAEILVGVLLLTFMVFLFQATSTFSDTVDKNIEAKNVNEFNAPLEKYRGRTDITAQDIVTMGNYAREYNEQIGSIQLEIIVNGVGVYGNAHKLGNKRTDGRNLVHEFIQKYSYNEQTKEIMYFKCIQMNYNEETGKIDKITIEKL